MNRFADRLERDLATIADRAAPSPTAWESIQHRSANQDADQEMEIIVLSPDHQPDSTRRRARVGIAAAILLLLVAGLLVANRSNDDDSSATQPDTESTEPAAPPDDEVQGWSMDAVGPGSFATSLFEPGFIITYPQGWSPYQPESRNQLNIEIAESTELGCEPCAFLAVNAVDASSPEDVIASATQSGLQFAEPEEVTVGGVAAQRYEVTGGAGTLFETEFSTFEVDSAEGPSRVTLADVDGRVIVIVELSSPDVVDAVWSQSDDIITGIEWTAE